VDRFDGNNDIDIRYNGELALLRSLLPASKVVLDIGANVGEWMELAVAINPSLEIHCFEPDPETFRLLTARTVSKSVWLNQAACGATEGVQQLYRFGSASMMNSLYARQGLEHVGVAGPNSSVMVPVRTIDNYCAELGISRVDLVKIDVEGHELAVLQGMLKSLRSGIIRAIQFEYGGTYIDARCLLRDVWNEILGANDQFRFYKICAHGRRPVTRYTQDLENFQFQNWLACLEQ
jgi:FkbM family methyltransferase